MGGNEDRSIRIYVQIGGKRLKCVAESEGPRYKWTGTTYSDGWGGPEGSIVIEFTRRRVA